MGVVYLGAAPDGRLVSVKTLRPWLVGGADGRRRFEREVATLLRVRGRRVAEVVDADVNADPPYIVTRYVKGVPLTRLVAEHGPLRDPQLGWLARGLLEALMCVHAANVIHRDVKPANVLISEDGPVLIDFGIAHATEDTRLTATGFISGTPGYLAPETVVGQDPTPATDLHGWAATLAFAATGRPPYGHGPDIAVLDRIRRGEHDLRGVEAGLAVVLEAALRVNPRDRPTVVETMRALDQPAAPQTLAMPLAPAPGPPPDPTVETRAMRQAPPPLTQPAPSQQPPPPAGEPMRSWRSKLVIGLFAPLLVFTISWMPYVGAVAALGILLIGRVTWRIKRRLFERRKGQGQHRSDRLVAGMALPWDLLASVGPSLGQAIVALLGALAAGGLLNLADVGGTGTPYLGAATVATLLMWWGPGAVRVRHGLRAVVSPLDRAPRTAWAVIGVVGLAVCGSVLLWESFGTLWWPTQGPPGLPVSLHFW